MILATLLATIWWVMAHFPDTPTGRMLRHWTVERPVAQLARIRRGQVILLFLFVVAVAGLVWLVGEETTRLAGMAAPEVIGWAGSFEIASLIDLTTTAIVAAGVARVGHVTARIRAWVPRRRSARARRTGPKPDEDRPAPRRHVRRAPARYAVRRAPGRSPVVAWRR